MTRLAIATLCLLAMLAVALWRCRCLFGDKLWPESCLMGLAILLTLAMPTLAIRAAPSLCVTFAPASGPVSYYEARVRSRAVADTGLVAYEDVRYLSPDATPRVEIPLLPTDPYWIDVRARNDELPEPAGPWSDVHALMADLNEDGLVGVVDFLRLVEEWGQPRRGVRMFIELSQHWLDATVWDEVLGLRRYADE